MNRDVRRYQAAVRDNRRALFEQLQALVIGMYPDAELRISYGILMYRTKSGWVGLGYWKGGVSLYTSVPPLIAEFRAAHPGIKTGKGSINFRVLDRIPTAALKRVIRGAVERRSR